MFLSSESWADKSSETSVSFFASAAWSEAFSALAETLNSRTTTSTQPVSAMER